MSNNFFSSVVLPLQRPYDGPFAVLCRGPYSFTLQVRAWDEIIADSCLKPCMDRDTKPGSLRRRLNRQERARWPNWPLPATAVCLLPGGSHFQTPWSPHLHARSGREKRLGTVFFPTPQGGPVGSKDQVGWTVGKRSGENWVIFQKPARLLDHCIVYKKWSLLFRSENGV